MLRLLNMLVLFFAIALLSGCDATRQHYEYSPPEGKQPLACIASCKAATNSCTQICALKNSTCRSEMKVNATRRYLDYKSMRNAQGLPIKKTYADFERTSSCTHSCNCIPSYNTCYSACGGRVY